MPYDPITLLSTLSTIALPPDTQDSLSVSWLDSYRMGFPPMKHYTLCWAQTNRLPLTVQKTFLYLSTSKGASNWNKRKPCHKETNFPTANPTTAAVNLFSAMPSSAPNFCAIIWISLCSKMLGRKTSKMSRNAISRCSQRSEIQIR